jgi:hypothetical protein
MLDPIAENPFHVLELDPDTPPLEVERHGARLLALLELAASGAEIHASPRGPRRRDASSVRAALAALRDPRARVVYEAWARLPAAEAPPQVGADPAAPFPEALVALGFARRP